MSRFETQMQYIQWLEDVVNKIYHASIKRDDEAILEAVYDISSKIHIPEGECPYDTKGKETKE